MVVTAARNDGFPSAVAAGLAIAGGIALAYLHARAFVGGPLRSLSILTMPVVTGFVIAGCIFIVIGLLTRQRLRRACFLAALVAISQVAILPIGRVRYESLVSDAKAHCETLASVVAAGGASGPLTPPHPPDRNLPLLCQPGYSVRYRFSFDRDGSSFTCTFPDPVAPRAAWYGSSDGNAWYWELLMD